MDNFTVQFKQIGLDEVNAKLDQYNAKLKTLVHNTNGTVNVTGKVSSAQDQQANSTNQAANATDRAAKSQANYFAHIAKTTVQSAIINKLFLEFVDVSDQAIKQVDLMNNFPTTMASMGQSTEASTEAFKALSDYVGQVGGNLGDAASAVTRFTGVTNDVKSAVAIFQGLNNALIAGDSSMEEQRLAAMQFAQAFERGKPDMKEWMSLTTNMSQQLNLVAEEMGYVNADALGSALREGEESMGAFTTELTKMSTGTGPIAQQALARMQGMQFAFNVMKNTMVQGLAAIINAFGRANIVNFFSFLTQVISVTTQAIAGLISAVISLVNVFRGLFGMPPLTLEKDLGEGAEQALNLGDNLDGAKKKAKELNKSLASFDKMNVLPEKTGKDDDEAGAGGTKFDAAQNAALASAFDSIVPKIQEASLAAKIFAGVLGGIAAINIFKAMADSFNNFIETTDNAAKNIDRVKTALKGDGEEKKNIFSKAGDSAKTFAAGISGLMAGLGAALMNPWVLLGLAIAAIVVGLIYLYNTNEDFKKGFDAVWGGFVEIVMNVAKAISEGFGGAIEWIKKEIAKLPAPFQDAFRIIGDVFKPVIGFFNDLFKAIGLTGPPMEQFGQFIGGVAIAVALLTGVWAAFKLVMIGVNIVTGIFSGIMAVITSPITLVVLAIAALIAIVALLIIYWDDIVKFAKSAWDGVVDAFNAADQWFLDEVIQPIRDLFQGLWDGIVALWNGFDEWITGVFTAAWDGIVAIWGGVVYFFEEVWRGIQFIFFFVVAFYKGVFLAAWDAIKFIWNVAVEWFRGIWNGIVAIFNVVKDYFGNKFREAWDAVKAIFADPGAFFGQVWDRIKGAFGGVASFFADTFKGAFNGVAGLIEGFVNNAINLINKLIDGVNKVSGKVGVPQIPHLPKATLPRLARGGIVEQATVAMIGENGREAVVPLENNTEWIDKLAAKINSASGGDGRPVQLVVQIGEEKIVTKVIDLINERTQMSGRNKILV